MTRPHCPRCGSELIVSAPSVAPSELVMELRGEDVPAVGTDTEPLHWLCRFCGYRWDPTDRGRGPVEVGEPSGTSDRPLDLEVTDPPSPAIATPVATHASPGTVLRLARQAAGKTVADASEDTGVWDRHLEALESDAPVEEFPAPTYARLYLRGYAEFLHLDPEPLLREFDALHPVVEEPTLEPLSSSRGRTRVVAVVVAVLSAAVLIFMAFHRAPSTLRADSSTRLPGSPVAHDPRDLRVPGPAPREPNGVRVALTLRQPSWVEVVSDGKVIQATTLQAGKAVDFRADRSLQLTLGNAGGVRLRVNGEQVATGGPGEVVRFDFRWRHGTVSTVRG